MPSIRSRFDIDSTSIRRRLYLLKFCKEVIYWYEKSAKQGDQDAQFNLAKIYNNGDGIDKDIDKAIY